jgi:hypothetical protein
MGEQDLYIQSKYNDQVKIPNLRFNVPNIVPVQSNSVTPQSPASTVAVTFTKQQALGNLNVVAIGWGDATSTILSVTDSRGNTYTLAVGVTRGTAISQSIYYARNIASSLAGSNTITVVFSGAVTLPDVRVAEYAGLDRTSPLDVTVAAAGTGTTADSGSIATTNANDILVGASYANVATTGPGAGFTTRILSAIDANILEDQIVTATGSNHATAPLASSGNWVMQMVALKAA